MTTLTSDRVMTTTDELMTAFGPDGARGVPTGPAADNAITSI